MNFLWSFLNYLRYCCAVWMNYLWPYSKSKFEVDSNLSEILPVNFPEICQSILLEILPKNLPVQVSLCFYPNSITKHKLQCLKSDFKCKKDINIDERYFASLEFDFFRVLLKLALRIRPIVCIVLYLLLLMILRSQSFFCVFVVEVACCLLII